MNPLKIQSSRYVNAELKPVIEIKIIIDLEEVQDYEVFLGKSKVKEHIISQLTDFLNES
jgi:hypothetical protein